MAAVHEAGKPPAVARPARARRVKTPTVLQMEALECGAAALAMVLGYHGLWIPLEELRVMCGVSRDGSKALNVVKAARKLGFKAQGLRAEPAGLTDIPLPAILFVNMNHFVVLEGFGPSGYYINDPASGRRLVSAEDFDGMFSGVALTFEKTEAFQPGGAPRKVLPALLALMRESWGPLAIILAAGVLMVLVTLITPAFNRVFIDYVMMERLNDWLVPLLVAMAVAAPTLALVTWIRIQLVNRLCIKLGLVLTGRLVWHILRLPVGYFTQRQGGMVGARVPLAEQIAQMASQQLAQMAVNVTTLVFFTALMVQYNAWLTLTCLALAAVNVAVFAWLQGRLGESSESTSMHAVKMEGKVMQGLMMIETLKATGSDEMFFSHWAGLQTLFINAQQRVAHLQAVISALPALTGALTSAAVLGLGGLFVIDSTMTVGMLVAFVAIMASFTAPVQELTATFTALRQAQGALAQVDDTLRHGLAGEIASGEGTGSAARTPRIVGHLSFHDVSVGYSPLEAPLIAGFSLDMVPGSRVALVGGSGSGKSTVGRLACGLLDPWQGEVRVDGTPLAQVPRRTLRNSLAVVDQDIALFEGSVRDNITLWDDSMPQANVVRAARDAMIHDAIMARPGGYDGRVDEGGRNFSGGQRQRLEIARALVANPSVLVLDEATSALDTVTEKAIVDNLRRRGCTCLIIAHRLSTIRDCDEIVVMERGRILERGTHEQLMAREGAYRALIET